MSRLLALLAASALLTPSIAHAQDDDEQQGSVRSSDDGDDTSRPTRKHKRPSRSDTADDELTETPNPDQQRMARMDDPHLGLGVELALSVDLLDKPSGPGVQGLPAMGLRVNWAPGTLWTNPEDEFWRNALVVELSYDYTATSDGTTEVNTSTHLHYVNVHAMLGYPVQSLLLLYGALGPGFTVETASYHVAQSDTGLTGIKFNVAYGIGARLAMPVSDRFAFATRLELMRYRRGYMDDLFLTLSLGGSF